MGQRNWKWQYRVLVGLLAMGFGSTVAMAQERAGPVDEGTGELLATHHCTTHGYVLRLYIPAGFGGGIGPDGSPLTAPPSERIIQVEPMAKQFHATWNEVANLIDNHPPDMLVYNALPNNPGPDGQRYCVRTGHLIPVDQTVYQVSLQHYNDYNGVSSVFSNSNADDTTPLHFLISTYNQLRDQGDALPATCPMGCLNLGSAGGVLPDTPWDGGGPGTYTTADGVVHDWDLGPGTDGTGPIRPDLGHEEVERQRFEQRLPSVRPADPAVIQRPLR